MFRTTLAGSVAVLLVLLSSTPLAARALGVAVGLALALGSVLATATECVDGELLVMALLIGRIVYRVAAAGALSAFFSGNAAQENVTFADSIGRLLVLALVTYFAAYHIGILSRFGTGNPDKPAS